MNIPRVALAIEQQRHARRSEHTPDIRDGGVIFAIVEPEFAASARERGDGLDAAERLLVAPILAFEVERVFAPVAGVDEREVDQDAGLGRIGHRGRADHGVAKVKVAVAPRVDGSVTPTLHEARHELLDAFERLIPFLLLGDDTVAQVLAGLCDVRDPIWGLWGWRDRAGQCGALLESRGGVEELVEGIAGRARVEGLSGETFQDQPREVVAADGLATREHARRGERV